MRSSLFRYAIAACLPLLNSSVSHASHELEGQGAEAISLLQKSASAHVREGVQEMATLRLAVEDLEVQSVNETKDAATFSLPRFESPANLHRSPKWLAYLSAVYGPMVQEDSVFPIDVSKFWVLDQKHLSSAGLDVQVKQCPDQELDVFSAWNFNPNGLIHIHHRPPFDALPSDSWVEVTHCDAQDPPRGYWLYYLPGSGIFYNLGKTKVFKTHRDAAAEFLPGRTCKDAACGELLYDTFGEAAKSYDSLQFLAHGDQQCGKRGFEIVELHHVGADICSLPVAGGFGRCSCACKKTSGRMFADTSVGTDCLSCELDCSSPPSVRMGNRSHSRRLS
mmetsp:Transcript_13780/g.26279  ORF Transcript_13780/g.26279 Transcript_13780/m.26279 type:complete len:335 (-) Transcript_13780:38-1042(-)